MSYVPSFMDSEESSKLSHEKVGTLNNLTALKNKREVMKYKVTPFKNKTNEKIKNGYEKIMNDINNLTNPNFIANFEKNTINQSFTQLKNAIVNSKEVNSDSKKFFSNLNFDQYNQKGIDVQIHISKCKDFLLNYLKITDTIKNQNNSKSNNDFFIKFIFDDQPKYNKTFQFKSKDELNKIKVIILLNYNQISNPGFYLSDGKEIDFNKEKDLLIGDDFKGKLLEVHIRSK